MGARALRILCGLVLAAAGLIGAATPAAAVSAAPTPSQTVIVGFHYTGAPQMWTVPASRVHSVTVDALGAPGGNGISGAKGLGGQATATFAVTPGQELQVNVGGNGGDAVVRGRSGSEGGWNGGAPGGRPVCDDTDEDGDPIECPSYPGGGGGGGSDVRRSPYTLYNRIVTGGGGGGGSAFGDEPKCADSRGGAGGGLTGGSYFPCGGEGGSQTTGGRPGSRPEGPHAGFAGTFGEGGAGGFGQLPNYNPQGAGGGGGGWYGGGGGAIWQEVDRTQGGGGGSGFGPAGVVFRTGVPADTAMVVITYTVDTMPPVLDMPADIITVATNESGAPVNYSFSASDVDGTVVSSGCTPMSGGTFPNGPTTVTCSATDDSGNTASGSFRINVQAPTNSLFNSSANPSVFGQRVFLAADVCKSSESGPVPTGSLRFTEGETLLGVAAIEAASSPLCARATSAAITGLGLGQHYLLAAYSGDANYARSSQSLTQTVNQAGTTVAITSSVNPSIYGDSVTFTATVSPQAPSTAPSSAPTGSVAFSVGGASMDLVSLMPGTQAFTAQASVSLSSLSAQSHSVTADYWLGDANFSSNFAPTYSQVVNKAPTAVAVSCGPNPVAFGESFICTATVSPGPGQHDGVPTGSAPTGVVAVTVDGGALSGVPSLSPVTGSSTSATQFVVGGLPRGDHAIAVRYAGGGNYLASGPTSTSERVTCSRTLTGNQSSLTVSPGEQVCLERATVKGSVTVKRGGALAVVDSTISGPVSSDGAQAVRLCSTRLGASLTITASTGYVLLGDGGDEAVDPCAGNSVGAGVSLRNNRAGLRIGRASLAGTLTVSDNPAGSGAHLAPAIEANAIGGAMVCRGNAVTPTNNGHPNTVRGARSGQCSGL